MRSDARWWDGPWPWLAYLVTYGIPWLWLPPSGEQLLLSAVALGIFLTVYFRSFHLTGKAQAGSVALMVVIGVALVPVGGGWSGLAVYPAMQAARLRPRRVAIWAIPLCMAAFLVAGLLSRQPLIWWLPSLILPAWIGGAALSREAFYDRTRALLATQEEVRRLAGLAEHERMARDLHDVIGRTLTLIALKADLVERLAVKDGDAAAQEARSIGEQARAGFAEIRAALDGKAGGSLAGEITASIAALKAASIQVEVRGDQTAIPPDAGAILAMTLREAVTNVIRHAGAGRCEIELARQAREWTLIVIDDGSGTAIVEGNGLTGMRQRLVAAGGALVIQSESGTTLVASVPA
ncbi:two-component system sensor histidine kinase DesK [Rhizomicrobium palustre]|uniref:Two-component system sensor histidine kinase DesK n=1 Tax=Rhizomicrobium palustre TaxID=189966 RepID=A0A846MUX8_9PROT|nr:histidine kinase [Rhizomicrobium palustre]NIK86817.1 two-component system sensor histidine kinase DesK [Rhizomicrobium palustre]